MKTARLLPLLLAASLAASGAVAQTVATGAGREDELSEAARIDAYLGAASAAPVGGQATDRVSPAESAASAGALPRGAALPPMAADSPWARGTVGPISGPLPWPPPTATRPPATTRSTGRSGLRSARVASAAATASPPCR